MAAGKSPIRVNVVPLAGEQDTCLLHPPYRSFSFPPILFSLPRTFSGGQPSPLTVMISCQADALSLSIAPYREAIQELTSTRYAHAKPRLLGILANDDPAARKYAEWTGKACVNDGIEYQLDQV
jgi:methylenetetrahydrofolate dehydrogenase (NAD+)